MAIAGDPASSTRSPPPAASVRRQPARLRQPGLGRRRDRRDPVAAATEWSVDGTTVTLTLARGHHLFRRQRLHRDDRRRQHRLRRRPQEQERLPRHLPAGRRDRRGRRRRRHRDDHAGAAGAVRAQRPRQPADGLRRPACRTASRWPRPPTGTGPYELTEAVPGDHYTYQIRDGYTWGPNGATTVRRWHGEAEPAPRRSRSRHRHRPRQRLGHPPEPGRRMTLDDPRAPVARQHDAAGPQGRVGQSLTTALRTSTFAAERAGPRAASTPATAASATYRAIWGPGIEMALIPSSLSA